MMNAMIATSSASCQRSCVKISSMPRLPALRRAEAKRVRDAQCARRLFHIVDAHDVGPPERGGDGRRDASLQPLVGTEIENFSDDSLARRADEQREAERAERRQSTQQREIMLEILAETDARIDHDVIGGDAGRR